MEPLGRVERVQHYVWRWVEEFREKSAEHKGSEHLSSKWQGDLECSLASVQ
jgi:hypothetical protein